MKIVIIEDERRTAKRLISLLEKYDSTIEILAELSSVTQSVAWFKEHFHTSEDLPDLAFMDIHLEDGDCFQIIKELDLKVPIIFTTAFDNYMVRAFKVNSIDYLLKPIEFDELVAAIDKFKSLNQVVKRQEKWTTENLLHLQQMLSAMSNQQKATEYKDRFMVSLGTKIRAVKTSDIAYFFLQGRTVSIAMHDGTMLPVDYSLDKVSQLVDPKDFFRINRQFIITFTSIQHIHTFSAGKLKIDLKPKAPVEVFVSSDRVSAFKEWLGK